MLRIYPRTHSNAAKGNKHMTFARALVCVYLCLYAHVVPCFSLFSLMLVMSMRCYCFCCCLSIHTEYFPFWAAHCILSHANTMQCVFFSSCAIFIASIERMNERTNELIQNAGSSHLTSFVWGLMRHGSLCLMCQ